MKSLILSICAIYAAILALQGTGLSQTPLQTVSLPHLSVQLTLDYNAHGDPVLQEVFQTDDPAHYSVICRSGFLDIGYTLKDASGRVIPANKEPWKNSSDIPYGTETGYVRGAPDPCTSIHTARSVRKVVLSAVYPNLPHGTYQLQVRLTPRGRVDQATGAPMTVTF